MKQIKLMAVALLLVVLVSMPAFAASQVVVATPSTVAYEILGTTRAVNVTADSGKPVGITLGNTLLTGDTVNLTLSGGALFGTASYYLCANNDTSQAPAVIGSQAAASNTFLSIPIGLTAVPTANVSAGANLWLTSVTSCAAISGASLNLQVAASTPVGSAALSGNVTAYAGTLRSALTANNVVTIQRQFASALNSGVLVSIDYITGPANGTTLVSSTLGSNTVAGTNTLTLANTTTMYNVATVSASFNQVLSLTDGHGDWAGITRAYAVTGTSEGACTGTVVASANAVSGSNITLHIPNASNSVGATLYTTLCVNVAGNTTIPSRSIYGSYSYELSTGTNLNLPAGGGGATTVFQAWTPNGYQAFNPYMYVGTSQDTLDVFCRFYNSSIRTALVFVDVYPADGSAATRYTLDSIPANTAATYWGSTIGALASLSTGTSYAALFTITAPPSQINGVSFFKRSTGERQLPLYKQVWSTDQYLSQ